MKYNIEYGEGLRRQMAQAMDGIFANARNRIARDAVSVCTKVGETFIQLRRVHETGMIDDSDRNTAYVHVDDANLNCLALLSVYADSRKGDIIKYQGVLSFPADETLRIVRAIIDASKHKGPLPYFDNIIGFKDYKLN